MKKKFLNIVGIVLVSIIGAHIVALVAYSKGYTNGKIETTTYISHHMDSLFRRFYSVERNTTIIN